MSNSNVIPVTEVSPSTNYLQKLKDFALSQLQIHRLREMVENFEFVAFQFEGKPVFNAVFYDEAVGFVSVMNIVMIANKPICNVGIRVSMHGAPDHVL